MREDTLPLSTIIRSSNNSCITYLHSTALCSNPCPGDLFVLGTGLSWLYSLCPGEFYGNFCTKAQNTRLHLACTSALDSGPGSVVDIATGYGLDGQGIESRWGARFSAPVQTGPGAHPASCTMGTGSFPRVKNGRCVTLTPHSLLEPWSRKGRAILLLPL